MDLSRRRLSVWNSTMAAGSVLGIHHLSKINSRPWLVCPLPDSLSLMPAWGAMTATVWELRLQVRKGLLKRPLPFDLNESKVKYNPTFSRPIVSDFLFLIHSKHTQLSQFPIDSLCCLSKYYHRCPLLLCLCVFTTIFALSRTSAYENIPHTWASNTTHLNFPKMQLYITSSKELFPHTILCIAIIRNIYWMLEFFWALCCRFHWFT